MKKILIIAGLTLWVWPAAAQMTCTATPFPGPYGAREWRCTPTYTAPQPPQGPVTFGGGFVQGFNQGLYGGLLLLRNTRPRVWTYDPKSETRPNLNKSISPGDLAR